MPMRASCCVLEDPRQMIEMIHFVVDQRMCWPTMTPKTRRLFVETWRWVVWKMPVGNERRDCCRVRPWTVDVGDTVAAAPTGLFCHMHFHSSEMTSRPPTVEATRWASTWTDNPLEMALGPRHGATDVAPNRSGGILDQMRSTSTRLISVVISSAASPGHPRAANWSPAGPGWRCAAPPASGRGSSRPPSPLSMSFSLRYQFRPLFRVPQWGLVQSQAEK